MKKTIVIALILISNVCMAQIDTSAHLTLFVTKGLYSDTTMQPVVFDTVRMIMLVCDTALIINSSFVVDSLWQLKDSSDFGMAGHNEIFYLKPDSKVTWQIGYEVRSKVWKCCKHADQYLDSHYWDYIHVKYLDADKQPLNKNIFIWLTKTLR